MSLRFHMKKAVLGIATSGAMLLGFAPAASAAPCEPNEGTVYQEPVYQQPIYQEPIYQEPIYQQPVYQAPVYAPPVVYRQPRVIVRPAPVVVMRPGFRAGWHAWGRGRGFGGLRFRIGF